MTSRISTSGPQLSSLFYWHGRSLFNNVWTFTVPFSNTSGLIRAIWFMKAVFSIRTKRSSFVFMNSFGQSDKTQFALVGHYTLWLATIRWTFHTTTECRQCRYCYAVVSLLASERCLYCGTSAAWLFRFRKPHRILSKMVPKSVVDYSYDGWLFPLYV